MKRFLIGFLTTLVVVPAVVLATDYATVVTQDFDHRDINLDILPNAIFNQSQITGLVSALAAKFDIPTGNTSQYIRGDGTLANLPTPSPLSFNNTASHSFVSTAAAANGFQLSSTRNTSVFYSVNISTTATIGGSSDGYVVLEISATNSTDANDWKEVSRTRNGQSISLALVLQSVQSLSGELMNIVPAGYYARLRTVTISGTPVFTFVSGQEVQL